MRLLLSWLRRLLCLMYLLLGRLCCASLSCCASSASCTGPQAARSDNHRTGRRRTRSAPLGLAAPDGMVRREAGRSSRTGVGPLLWPVYGRTDPPPAAALAGGARGGQPDDPRAVNLKAAERLDRLGRVSRRGKGERGRRKGPFQRGSGLAGGDGGRAGPSLSRANGARPGPPGPPE